MPKLVWRTQDVPTGRYRSFFHRGWPDAHWNREVGPPAVQIRCEDEYIPRDVKTGNHKPLRVYIADWSPRRGLPPEIACDVSAFNWKLLKGECKTLDEAKALAERAFESHPHFRPTEVCLES